MRKFFNYKNVAKVLAVTFIVTLLCAMIPILKINKVFADTSYDTNYLNVKDDDLDNYTRRTNESEVPAQITVFTPGVGGSASHWSNEIERYHFAYDSTSMIEQLRQELGVNNTTVYVMKMGYTGFSVTTNKNDDPLYQSLRNNTVEESQSTAIGTNFSNGATDLQAKYDKIGWGIDKKLVLFECGEKVYPSTNYMNDLGNNGTVNTITSEDIENKQ